MPKSMTHPPFHSPTYRKAYNHALKDVQTIVESASLSSLSPLEGINLSVIFNVIKNPREALKGAIKSLQAEVVNRISSLRQPD